MWHRTFHACSAPRLRKWFRPGGGLWTSEMLAYTEGRGYTAVTERGALGTERAALGVTETGALGAPHSSVF